MRIHLQTSSFNKACGEHLHFLNARREKSVVWMHKFEKIKLPQATDKKQNKTKLCILLFSGLHTHCTLQHSPTFSMWSEKNIQGNMFKKVIHKTATSIYNTQEKQRIPVIWEQLYTRKKSLILLPACTHRHTHTNASMHTHAPAI